MKLLQRIKLAIKYDFSEEFIVIPFGDKDQMIRFLKYDDANQWIKDNTPPQFLRPSVMIAVRRTK